MKFEKYSLNWVGDQPMKMRETSRVQNKESADNNKLFINPERNSFPDIDFN